MDPPSDAGDFGSPWDGAGDGARGNGDRIPSDAVLQRSLSGFFVGLFARENGCGTDPPSDAKYHPKSRTWGWV